MSTIFQANFEVQKTDVNHTKNPYCIKRVNVFDQIAKEGILDGYNTLIWSNCELPNEVVFLQISNRGIKMINEIELADNNFLNLQHFFFLKNLQSLTLQQNQILELPKLQNQFENLEELDLSFNKIKNFQNLKFLTKLKILNIAGNNIQKLNFGHQQQNSIQDLNLSFNCLSEQSDFQLWKKLSKFSNLKILKLNNNNFQTIQEPPNIMQKFNLEFLDLSSNHFKEEVDLICLSTMTNLQKLNLSQNENLFQINNLVQVLKQQLNTQTITEVNQNLNKVKAITNYKNMNIIKIKKQLNFENFIENKKEIFDKIIEEPKPKKPNMFLTSINYTQKKNKKFPNLKTQKTKDVQILAQILLKEHQPLKLRNLNQAYNELNKYI